jgi:hypothetical protein
MFANAFFVTTVLLLALGIWLLGECRFLIPYRGVLWDHYTAPIGLFVAALFVNLFAVIYLAGRKLFLKDCGGSRHRGVLPGANSRTSKKRCARDRPSPKSSRGALTSEA